VKENAVEEKRGRKREKEGGRKGREKGDGRGGREGEISL